MIYVLAFFLPPLALLCRGLYGHALLNLFLSLMCLFPGSLHAIVIIMRQDQERRHNQLVDLVLANGARTVTPLQPQYLPPPPPLLSSSVANTEPAWGSATIRTTSGQELNVEILSVRNYDFTARWNGQVQDIRMSEIDHDSRTRVRQFIAG